MDLPLEERTRFGVSASLPYPEAARATIDTLERLGYDSLWVGDHIAFAQPIHDPIVQLALAAAYPSQMALGTAVYLLPLRHPVAVAKQVSTLDRVTNGRLLFGVGLGGEFPEEFAAVGVRVAERGARLTEGIEVLRALWSGAPVAHEGRFYPFPTVHIRPGPLRPGGPPILCGGRAEAALARIGRQADGWIAYVVTPQMYASGLATIAGAAAAAGRRVERFTSAHVLFAWLDDDPEAAFAFASGTLGERYGMDFRGPARRYVAHGRPADVAERIAAFHAAGVRHFILDFLATDARRDEQLERFAAEVRPLLGDLGAGT